MLRLSVLPVPLPIAPQDTKGRIIAGASQLYHRYGIKSITMDEVARHLAISKKTLYQFFDNKDSLVMEVAQAHLDEDCQMWNQVQADATSALHEMILISETLRQEMAELNPTLVYDLQRFYPKAWSLFEDQRECVFEKAIQLNMHRGIQEGSYRADIDVHILSRLRFELVKMSFDPDLFPPTRYDFMMVQMQFMELFVRGLLTEGGLHAWNELKVSYQPAVPDSKKI